MVGFRERLVDEDRLELGWKSGWKNEEPPGQSAGGEGKREERDACPT
jgi:hypothetical protein